MNADVEKYAPSLRQRLENELPRPVRLSLRRLVEKVANAALNGEPTDEELDQLEAFTLMCVVPWLDEQNARLSPDVVGALTVTALMPARLSPDVVGTGRTVEPYTPPFQHMPTKQVGYALRPGFIEGRMRVVRPDGVIIAEVLPSGTSAEFQAILDGLNHITEKT